MGNDFDDLAVVISGIPDRGECFGIDLTLRRQNVPDGCVPAW
jgi:hypothetical protein